MDRVVLPGHILPNRYDLHLAPDLERFTYDGKVIINVKVAEPTPMYVSTFSFD